MILKIRFLSGPGLILIGFLMLLFSSGIEGMLTTYLPMWPWSTKLYGDIALGLLISGLLAVTIDRALKQEFAKDVFRATIGYALPDQLRSELEYFYGQKLVCISSLLQVSIGKGQRPDMVEVKVVLIRKLQNMSGESASVSPSFEVENHISEPIIRKIHVTRGGLPLQLGEKREMRSFSDWIGCSMFRLDPGQSCEITIEYSYEKYLADSIHETWISATSDPTLTLLWDHEFDVEVKVNSHRKASLRWIRCDGDHLKGQWGIFGGHTLLPYHGVVIRWKRLQPNNDRYSWPGLCDASDKISSAVGGPSLTPGFTVCSVGCQFKAPHEPVI